MLENQIELKSLTKLGHLILGTGLEMCFVVKEGVEDMATHTARKVLVVVQTMHATHMFVHIIILLKPILMAHATLEVLSIDRKGAVFHKVEEV